MNISRHDLSRAALVAAVVSVAVFIPSCKGYDGKKAAEERTEWIASLNDSVKYLENLNLSNANRIDSLRTVVAGNLESFSTVDNPREVEPYYIYTPFKASYPLTSTGLAVRILKNETPEVIAASTRPFSAIEVSNGGRTYRTPVVPPDQALNYTANGLTTVSFTGAVADTISAVVAGAQTPARVIYLNPGETNSCTLPENVMTLFRATRNLYDNQTALHRLEREINVNARKIEILKLTLHKDSTELR